MQIVHKYAKLKWLTCLLIFFFTDIHIDSLVPPAVQSGNSSPSVSSSPVQSTTSIIVDPTPSSSHDLVSPTAQSDRLTLSEAPAFIAPPLPAPSSTPPPSTHAHSASLDATTTSAQSNTTGSLSLSTDLIATPSTSSTSADVRPSPLGNELPNGLLIYIYSAYL